MSEIELFYLFKHLLCISLNMHKKITFALIAILVTISVDIKEVSAQDQEGTIELEFGQEKLISKSDGNLHWIEPVLTVHPTDQNILIGVSFGSYADDYNKDTPNLSLFISRDGGKEWEVKELSCTACTDPWLTYTNKGVIFLTVMGKKPNDPESHIYNLLVFTSTDNGESWSENPQFIEGAFDGPKTISAPDGTLYLTSHVSSRNNEGESRNAIYVGRAEPGETKINTLQKYIPSNLGFNADSPIVTSDGSLYISYFDFMRKANGGFRSRESRLTKRRAWVIKSTDRGETFSEDLFVTEEASFRPNSLISTAFFDDRLFFASMNENLNEVIFLYSPDKGDEWVQTSIEAPAEKERTRFFPQMMVNKDSILAVAWMDERSESEEGCYAPYISFSTDGGESFSPPQMISSTRSCPDKENRTVRRWNHGGDYFGLTASSDGKFHILWPDARNGLFEIWYTSIEVKSSHKD